MKPPKHDPAPEVTKAIQAIITACTPKQTTRGKSDRNRLVKAAIFAAKSMTYDRRVNKA